MTDQLEITDPRDGSQQSVAVPSGLVHLRADGGTIVLSPDASGASLRIVPTQRGRRLEPLLPGSMIEVSGQQLFCKDLAPGDRFEFAGRRIVWRSDVELPLAGAASRSTQRPRRHDGAAAAMMAEPVRLSPVKVMASTSLWVTRCSPAEPGPKPWTTL